MNTLIEIKWLYLLGLIFGSVTFLLLLIQRRFFNSEARKHGSLKVAIEAIEAERKAVTEKLDSINQQFEENTKRLSDLLAKEAKANEFEERIVRASEKDLELESKAKSLKQEIEETQNLIYDLKSEADLYTRVKDFIDVGHFEEPKYLFETSERFKIEIKRVRREQKELIKEKKAIDAPYDDIEVEGSSKKGKAVLQGQEKMLLRAFNIECDFLIGKVTPSNLETTFDRIQKTAEDLEKLSMTLLMGLTTHYVQLKLEECKLQYQFKLKKENELTEQKILREQMREEQNAVREYERAIAAAEKEEKMYRDMLERARNELSNAHDDETKEMQDKVALLEMQLREAEAKEERAKSMAQQTRRGHVYIISNIGSFGEHVYKIGLTRRLDPNDRVKELGDASVPFTFDIHALMFHEDAPRLEAELHRRFDAYRVNAVNRRKEFFNVSLDQIQNAVAEIIGNDVEFTTTAAAEDYYETLRLQGADSSAA